MAAITCLKGSFEVLLSKSQFFPVLPTARRVKCGAKLLQCRKRWSRNWTLSNACVSSHEHGLYLHGEGTSRAEQCGSRKRNRTAASAASGSSVGDGASIQDDFSGEEREKEKQREIKREKVRKRIIAGVDQTKLVDPWLLADPDSRFAEFYGVQLHHKIQRPTAVAETDKLKEENKVRLPAILLHGFGASLFSWERLMPNLAEVLGEAVLAFDRPAFGLTSRVFPPSLQTAEKMKLKFKNIYSVAFSAAATIAFINFIQAKQAILVGHSAGSLIAAEAYHQAPEKVAAIIFVAPALMAPIVMSQLKEATESEKREKKLEGEVKSLESSPALKVWAAIRWVWSKIRDLFRRIRVFLALAFAKLLGLLLRSPPGLWLVRRIMDKGGPAAVRIAFYDASKADKYVLDGYTKPLGCRDWERALVEYSLALIDNSDEQASSKKKLNDITCPVLVVTGDTDRIVPDWNTERLAKTFPNAEFKRIKNCGHLPQEETPVELVHIINDFLARNLQGGRSTANPAAAGSV